MTLEAFFNPSSVAIVGASRKPGRVGHEVLASLLRGGYEGDIFPVNPKAKKLEGLTCYPDLPSIGKTPDLVAVAVPAAVVPGVMRDCAKVGTRAVIIITSGFRETDSKGEALEREIVRIARGADIRIIGPNCLGVVAPWSKVNVSFAGEMPKPGRIAYFSQSGSLLAAILDMAASDDIGFSRLVSIGNKADVDEMNLMRAFGADPKTTVIAGYLESIDDGDAFIREAESISHEKPILLLKAGVTGAGARAASSHTGSLARAEAAYECVFERAGVIRCDSIKSQFDYARALTSQPIPAGPGVAIVANGGGPSIMATDAVERHGLTLAEFDEQTLARLTEIMPPGVNVHNPIDVLGDAGVDRFRAALELALDCPAVHTVLLMLTPHAVTDSTATAEAAVEILNRKTEKPMLACFLGGRRIAEAIRVLRDAHIPHYDSPESAVATIKVMTDYARWRARPKRVVKLFPVNRRKVEQIVSRSQRRGAHELGEMEAREILEAYGFITPQGAIATSAEQAANIAEQIGYPVVLKIWSPDIIHKSEVGGVRAGLSNFQEVMDAFDLMMYRIPKKAPEADILGVFVQEMCTKGHEVIMGMHRDPHFGPLMMFGMGGIMVEVLRDVAFYLAPLTAEEARQMLLSTRTYQLLQGAPGQEGVDIDAIAEGLQRLSQLAMEFPQIMEMEINPYIVGPEGTRPVAVDATITI